MNRRNDNSEQKQFQSPYWFRTYCFKTVVKKCEPVLSLVLTAVDPEEKYSEMGTLGNLHGDMRVICPLTPLLTSRDDSEHCHSLYDSSLRGLSLQV